MIDSANLLDSLRARLPDAALDAVASVDFPTFTVPREHVVAVLRVLRDDPDLAFTLLAELTAADYLPREPRFEVVYHLVRLPGSSAAGSAGVARVRLKVGVPGDAPSVPTASELFPNANWLEREVWDLFGIVFEGHADLRRLLLMDDWEGHPLRKDYPVQVKVPYQTTAAVQVTEEEFVANIERQRLATDSRKR